MNLLFYYCKESNYFLLFFYFMATTPAPQIAPQMLWRTKKEIANVNSVSLQTAPIVALTGI